VLKGAPELLHYDLFHKDNLNKFDIKDTYQFNNLLDNSLNLKDK
jgi:hypothetical protein